MRAFATRHARALIAAVVAAAALLLVALGAATLGPDEGYGWKGSADSSTSSTTSSSTTSSSTTSSSTTSSSTTTTEPATVPPRPTTSVVPPPARPAPSPTTAEPTPATTEPTVSSGPCADALVGVQAVGLPPGFSVYCSAEKTQGHAGLTGWNYMGESFVAINPATGNHPGVGAHEACHAQDFASKGASSEASADACARAHGYPNPYEHADDTLVGEKPASGPLLWLQLSVLAGVLVLIGAVLSLLPAIRRRLTNHHHRKD